MPPVGKDKIETQRGFAGPVIPMRIDTPVTALQRTCLPQAALVPSDWFVHVETIGAAVPCCSWKNGTLQVEQPPNQPALPADQGGGVQLSSLVWHKRRSGWLDAASNPHSQDKTWTFRILWF